MKLNDVAGSTLYYCALGLPKTRQTHYLAVSRYAITIAEIAEQYKEASVAQGKLVWWSQEIERAFKGEGTHPLAKTLSGLRNLNINATPFLAMIEAAQVSMTVSNFASQADLNSHYQHTGGIPEGLKAQILLNRELEEHELKQAHTLGIALEIVRHLNDMSHHLHRGHLYLPGDMDPTEDLTAAFIEQAELAKQLLNASTPDLPRPMKIHAAITQKLLRKIERSGFDIKQYQYSLSPLQKLITRWQTR